MRRLELLSLVSLLFLGPAAGGCSGDGPQDECDLALEFERGDDGHADPLAAVGPGQARAGRLVAEKLPVSRSGLAVWAAGDFVLANDRVAVIIEDSGPSDLYDPWGGRPVGIARVEDGALTQAADFGEFFVLTGRQSVITESVTVMNDGSDGGAAVIRASGRMAPIPFFETLVGTLLRDDFSDIPAAIEYVLEPDAEHVDIYMLYNSPRIQDTRVGVALHGFMYTPRMPPFAPDDGFDTEGETVPYLAFIDDGATSYAYSTPGHELGGGISASGFASNFGEPYDIYACSQTRRHYARLTIGGPGLDGLLQAVARTDGETLREITGVVRESDGAPAVGVRVHATDDAGNYLSRATSDESGFYRLHVPGDRAVELTTWRRGDAVVGPVAADVDTVDFTLEPAGFVHVVATDIDSGEQLPVRIQVLPESLPVPEVPEEFGEPKIKGGRVHVEYEMDGDATLRLPVGDWEVVVSRGFEYELYREVVTISAGATTEVQAGVERVVDTTGMMCADFHIHTRRSADSPDDGAFKLRSAVADGLEIPVRSDHEFVGSFQPLIEELGLQDWAFGVGSVEMTSFLAWGHMGVLPLEADPTEVNAGTPLWQRFPRADNPDVAIETLLPPEVFATVRARPERPIVIINHPRGNTNYFTVAGYDRLTGEVEHPEYWDEDFSVVEIFNSSSWVRDFDETVADWLSLLNNGRRIFAVGSSDSHKLYNNPVGYPRTCLEVGTDDPGQLTAELVRDATGAGHSSISGGIYMFVSVGEAGPGDEISGVGSTASVHVRVEAPSWVEVDWIDLVVDGEVVDQIGVLPGDADPQNPTIRYEGDLDVSVAANFGSYVIVAAYGETPLDPVHPNELPFGVSNPIFLFQ